MAPAARLARADGNRLPDACEFVHLFRDFLPGTRRTGAYGIQQV
jgi:hypothetical protein